MPGKGLYPAIAKGRFPLIIQYLKHDWFGHFAGYILNPDYAVIYREVAQFVVDQGGYMSLTEGQKNRIWWFNEMLTMVDRGMVLSSLESFHTPKSFGDLTPAAYKQVGYSVEQITEVLNKMSTNDILEASTGMVGLARRVIRRMGGISAEPDSVLDMFVLHRIRSLQGQIAYFQGESGRNQLIAKLASLESTILILSEISLVEWKDLILSPSLPTGYQVFELLGLRYYNHDRNSW